MRFININNESHFFSALGQKYISELGGALVEKTANKCKKMKMNS